MKLTVDDLIKAIFDARRLEQLQADVRQAMIDKLTNGASTSALHTVITPGTGIHELLDESPGS